MKITVIRKMVESYSLQQVSAAEEAILDGLAPVIEIEGEDEGEQLTHAYAAKWILTEMQQGKELKDALREFTLKIRTSIS